MLGWRRLAAEWCAAQGTRARLQRVQIKVAARSTRNLRAPRARDVELERAARTDQTARSTQNARDVEVERKAARMRRPHASNSTETHRRIVRRYDKNGTKWFKVSEIQQAGTTGFKDVSANKWMGYDGGRFNGGKWLHEP